MWAYRGLFLSCKQIYYEATAEVIKTAQPEYDEFEKSIDEKYYPDNIIKAIRMFVPQKLRELSVYTIWVNSLDFSAQRDRKAMQAAVHILFCHNLRTIILVADSDGVRNDGKKSSGTLRISKEYADKFGEQVERVIC